MLVALLDREMVMIMMDSALVLLRVWLRISLEAAHERLPLVSAPLLPDLFLELSVDSLLAQLEGGVNVDDRLPDSEGYGLRVQPRALVLQLPAIECAAQAD